MQEVQEKRARDAAREAAEAERRRMEASINPPQLELLPPAQMPEMNPLVATALKRIEEHTEHRQLKASTRNDRRSGNRVRTGTRRK